MTGVTPRDLATIVTLVASAADPTRDASLECRRHQLLSAVGEAIEADAWVCGAASLSESSRIQGFEFSTGCGWPSEPQRDEVQQALARCYEDLLLQGVHQNGAASHRRATLFKCDLSPGPRPNCQADEDQWSELGVKDFLLSMHAADASRHSLAAYFRRVGSLPFHERERTIVHSIFQHVPWLHSAPEIGAPGASQLAQLSKREREVLHLLLEGHSRKEVASRLSISAHTVADYLKVIHKKLGVTSRAELLAKFIPSK